MKKPSITATLEIEVPMVPNFIRIKGTEQMISISQLTDSQLSDLARAWKLRLIERAAEIRKAKGIVVAL